jgi:aspartate ammonia-lyase
MLAAAAGQLETNNYMPLIAVSLFNAISSATRAISAFDEHCIQPLAANRAANERNLLESTAIAPALKAQVGYERAAALVKSAVQTQRSLLDVVVESGEMSRERVLELLRQSAAHPD